MSELPESKRSADQHTDHREPRPRRRRGLVRIVDATINTWDGIKHGARHEAAIRLEMSLAALMIPASFFLAENPWQWLALISVVFLVLIVEMLNTGIERLCDHVTPERHETIRVIKDMGSAAVFFALITAGSVWGVVILSRFGVL